MKHTYKIKYLDKNGKEVYEEGVINDEPHKEILKKHANEFPEPHVVWLNGELTNY